ncbi:UDP-N-acetylglucosamine pyrophosphorylase /glucosamine-1-phosphate N-acetyltransferase [Tindallia magadiensis]|uniref:Bifunctional protein GlmU n=1 Tax=Tindallia magadiensis TaxID=69895 RepID=A0A1I3CZB0_9FIRM|nr:bifunctional UDP-N-acetylglucosamine diphosphorylase/glucosamine-1-phosphate N-acetyltransferase GlmU [Tindallia magadiensis]SFH79571.1 UDP-N-acetylglucosamine pyrophosphorylase /glucosamine-1-phosphate N-acetyltransferase [Tindallia magadiensis]
MKRQAVILAAGEGTRMKSSLPKVLHRVTGIPMINHVTNHAAQVGIEDLFVIVGHGAEAVSAALPENAKTVLQAEQKGTGHAVMCAMDQLDPEALVLVLSGDAPLISAKTLEKLIHTHEEGQYAATVLSAQVENPTGYGRVLRNEETCDLLGIIEEKDATPWQKSIKEINSGTYCFRGQDLLKILPKLSQDNAQQEYYLTDTLALLKNEDQPVGICCIENPEEIMAVNTRAQLAEVEAVFRKRINHRHMVNGVTMVHPENTYIDHDVTIGKDTVIEAGAVIECGTVIGEGCHIGQNSRISDSFIESHVNILHSTIISSRVGEKTSIGPYAYLRPGACVGKRVRIGNYVEIKNATIGDDSRAAHLAYIGDAKVGKDVNIGCGVVFVNYDGKEKYQTVVGNHSFVGSNANLIAPVTIGDHAFIAAGSTITEDVPGEALAIARSRQSNKEEWNKAK